MEISVDFYAFKCICAYLYHFYKIITFVMLNRYIHTVFLFLPMLFNISDT